MIAEAARPSATWWRWSRSALLTPSHRLPALASTHSRASLIRLVCHRAPLSPPRLPSGRTHAQPAGAAWIRPVPGSWQPGYQVVPRGQRTLDHARPTGARSRPRPGREPEAGIHGRSPSHARTRRRTGKAASNVAARSRPSIGGRTGATRTAWLRCHVQPPPPTRRNDRASSGDTQRPAVRRLDLDDQQFARRMPGEDVTEPRSPYTLNVNSGMTSHPSSRRTRRPVTIEREHDRGAVALTSAPRAARCRGRLRGPAGPRPTLRPPCSRLRQRWPTPARRRHRPA